MLSLSKDFLTSKSSTFNNYGSFFYDSWILLFAGKS